MRHNTFIFLLFSSILLQSVGFAQTAKPTTGSVTGKLLDPGNNPLSYATVTLLRMDSSIVNGDLSTDDGSFRIAPTGTGSFLLRIEAMGYAKKIVGFDITADAQDKKLGKVKLSASEKSLKEVSVVGEKNVMELRVDKKVFNVDKNTTTAGGSATDVLQNVPSVSVSTDGSVSLRGKSDVTILIDGKPATMLGSDVTSALQSLPASSIESVEVITNPSSKYDAQGTTGIINIITKKDGRLGFNGNLTLGAGTNDKYNGNLGLNLRKGKWNVFLNSSYRLNKTYNDITTDRVDRDSTRVVFAPADTQTVHRSYRTFEHSPRHFGGFFNTLGATFDPDKYNSITLTENINRMQFGYKDYSDYFVYNDSLENPDNITSHIASHQNRATDFYVNIFSISSALDYKRKFKKKDEELSVDATYAHTDFNRHQQFTTIQNNNLDTSSSSAPANGGNSSLNVWADYTDPLFTKNGKLGLGFKSQFYWFNSEDDPTVTSKGVTTFDASLYSKFKYSQQTHAAYVNWNDQLGKFSYQAGH